jgi:DinB superfamily
MTGEPTSFNEFLDDFRRTIGTAKTRLLAFSPPEDQTKSNPEKWTPREIIGHLIDSAANNHHRFVRAQFTDDLVFSGYEQDNWVSVQRYNEESWTDLVQLWALYNLHLLHLVSVIPKNVLTLSRPRHNLNELAWKAVDPNKPTTLEYFVRDYVGHMRHHLDQIFGNNAGI